MAQELNTNTSKLNPNPIKTIVPIQFIPQTPTAQGVQVQLFFEVQRYVLGGPATPENGYNAYPTRTPEYISEVYGM